MPHARQLRTSLNQANAEQSDSLIQENHCINVRELAKTVGISVIGVQTIDCEELKFSKVSTRRVPKLLSSEQRVRQNQISTQLLDCFERAADPFLHSVVTCDEAWAHYFTQQTKRVTTEWRHKDSPPKKRPRLLLPQGKSRPPFWDSRDVL